MVLHRDRHDRVWGLLAAYALGALEDDERGDVEGHLSGCRECRRGAITHLESVSFLMDEPLQVPGRVWDSIIDRVRNRAGGALSPGVPTPAPGPAESG